MIPKNNESRILFSKNLEEKNEQYCQHLYFHFSFNLNIIFCLTFLILCYPTFVD